MARAPQTDLPEPDRSEGTPHPRHAARLFGQAEAEAAFLAAWTSGRMHHAWLLAGPRGVGKATFAWRAARFLLTAEEPGGLFAPPPPLTLDAPQGHPALARIAALGEPRLHLVRRGPTDDGKALSQVITVGVVARLREFLHLTAADGGWRVVILDAADDLNPSAANAILKLLEEPPRRVVFLIVAHRPARLLATIRSRCRTLPFAPLAPQALADALAQAGLDSPDPQALAALAAGSAGAAARLVAGGGPAHYADLLAVLARGFDRSRALALADSVAGRGAEGRFDLVLALADSLLARLARHGATGSAGAEAAPGEAALLARLSPDARAAREWADLAAALTDRARRGRALNLDAATLCLDMLLRIGETAGRLTASQAAR